MAKHKLFSEPTKQSIISGKWLIVWQIIWSNAEDLLNIILILINIRFTSYLHQAFSAKIFLTNLLQLHWHERCIFGEVHNRWHQLEAVVTIFPDTGLILILHWFSKQIPVRNNIFPYLHFSLFFVQNFAS